MEQVIFLLKIRVKKGMESAFYEKAAKMMAVSREEDGCITFTYHQNPEYPCDFFLYEQWRDRDSLDAHVKNLQNIFGPAEEGKRLPKGLLDYWENWTVEKFNVVSLD